MLVITETLLFLVYYDYKYTCARGRFKYGSDAERERGRNGERGGRVIFTFDFLFNLLDGSKMDHRHVANKLHGCGLDEYAILFVPPSTFQINGAYVYAVLNTRTHNCINSQMCYIVITIEIVYLAIIRYRIMSTVLSKKLSGAIEFYNDAIICSTGS